MAHDEGQKGGRLGGEYCASGKPESSEERKASRVPDAGSAVVPLL